MLEEMAQHIDVFECVQKHLFMIAGKNADFASPHPFARTAHDSGAVRTTVNEIAK